MFYNLHYCNITQRIFDLYYRFATPDLREQGSQTDKFALFCLDHQTIAD